MPSNIVPYLLGSGGAAGLTLILILLGYLVPRAYYRQVVRDNKRLQAANDLLTEANVTLKEANQNLSSGAELTNKVVSGLMDIATEHRRKLPPGQGSSLCGSGISAAG